MNSEKEDLVNDLNVILRDYSSADSKQDSSNKISAVSSLLTDLIVKSELSPTEVMLSLDAVHDSAYKGGIKLLSELSWRKEKIDLCTAIIRLMNSELERVGRLTNENALIVIEEIIISGYRACGLSREHVDERLRRIIDLVEPEDGNGAGI